MSVVYRRALSWVVPALACAGLVACSGSTGQSGAVTGGTGGGTTGTTFRAGPALLAGQDCDPIVPTQCGYPFPSDVYREKDAAGTWHVRFGGRTLPRIFRGSPMNPSYYDGFDGFSAAGPLLVHLPGAAATGLPTPSTLDMSVSDSSPTLLVDAATGQRVPHFAELDTSASAETDRALVLYPASRLADGTRYLVFVRGVVDSAGQRLAPSAVFAALRDGTPSADPTVEPRRALYADLLDRARQWGIATADLQIAWDFTTASVQNNTRWLVQMRDEALADVEARTPSVRVTAVHENPSPHVWKRIEGMMRVPNYLDGSGRLVVGADGRVQRQGEAEYPFAVLVPSQARRRPLPAVVHGHGLLQDRFEGMGDAASQTDGPLGDLAEAHGLVVATTDMLGMTKDDKLGLLTVVTGDLGRFQATVDKQHQGILNQVVLLRLVRGVVAAAAELQAPAAGDVSAHPVIDTTVPPTYRGEGQGGIMGIATLALSPDADRGALSLAGMPYGLLLGRSASFVEFFNVLRGTYSTARDLQLVLGLMQMLWTRTEPTGWVPAIASPPPYGTQSPGTKRVLLTSAVGDFQVTGLATHILSRSLGAAMLTPSVREVWGLNGGAAPVSTGHVLTEYDFGVLADPGVDIPTGNLPPRAAGITESEFSARDPNRKLKGHAPALRQQAEFLRTGDVVNPCDGACDPQ